MSSTAIDSIRHTVQTKMIPDTGTENVTLILAKQSNNIH